MGPPQGQVPCKNPQNRHTSLGLTGFKQCLHLIVKSPLFPTGWRVRSPDGQSSPRPLRALKDCRPLSLAGRAMLLGVAFTPPDELPPDSTNPVKADFLVAGAVVTHTVARRPLMTTVHHSSLLENWLIGQRQETSEMLVFWRVKLAGALKSVSPASGLRVMGHRRRSFRYRQPGSPRRY